ncbi:VIT family protein [Periweissella fabaria]|uniref:VIT family protein n=1 Tax=Periweissella fabaria TaxID=546157 RepID=A0ABM8Z4R1_9LACO|nr:VIT family protein [Periweissella fabaria]MCM0596694.1 VIT family protein [Periweissella fabaria]CAH0416380.1 hypothetical protein WFA24289_00684 [Periweissella fabaria]
MAKKQNMDERLNAIRAGVLGSNDGILTVVGVLFSVAAATPNRFTILLAGFADLVACAFSMAGGEYASVSSQSDTEKAAVALEEQNLKHDYQSQIESVSQHYVDRGVTQATATAIAEELLTKAPLATVVNVKYNIDLGHYMNPIEAAVASLVSAALAGLLPLIAMLFLPESLRFFGTIAVTALTAGVIGYLSAKIGQGLVKRAIIRNIIISLITIAIHYGIGLLF